ARYVAFILLGGEPNGVHLRDLGEADRIDSLITTFRTEITGEPNFTSPRNLQLPADAPHLPLCSPGAGSTLRQMVFDPLVEVLGSRKQLLVAPDGNLNRLPFEVLPLGDGRRLIDEYRISYLSTGQDLLRTRATSTPRAGDPLVIGNPD